jgi:hypothetical protein
MDTISHLSLIHALVSGNYSPKEEAEKRLAAVDNNIVCLC